MCVASVFATALPRVASAHSDSVCVVGRDQSIDNWFHGEGQAAHSGKQKLRQEKPSASWSKCKSRGERVTSGAVTRPCEARFACVGGVERVRSGCDFT